MILNRRDLGEAVLAALGGAVVIATAFWFRDRIESFMGQTATKWLLNAVLFLYLLSLIPVVGGWVDIASWERAERKRKQEDERELAQLEFKEKQEQAEYDAFRKWAELNPRTVEQLLSVVEHEQIDDPEYLSWLRERRETEGPNPLTDLPRLFDWLKARRELRKFGIEPPLPRL